MTQSANGSEPVATAQDVQIPPMAWRVEYGPGIVMLVVDTLYGTFRFPAVPGDGEKIGHDMTEASRAARTGMVLPATQLIRPGQ